MTLAITGIYAALLAIIMLVLQVRVITYRAKHNIALLDGGNKDLALRMRQHGNFIENVPLALILIAIAELQGAGSTWLHLACGLLLAGRILHPFGLNHEKGATFARIAGGLLTQGAIAIAVYLVLWPVIAG